MNKRIFLVVAVALCCAATVHAATNTPGMPVAFNVDTGFDASARSQISAVLVKTSPTLYFYVEQEWWNQQTPDKQAAALTNFDSIAAEFDARIYPTLTSVFGSEWKPGVDGDIRITLLFESLKGGAAGYFRPNDEYLKLQVPDSNEREMLYFPVTQADDPQLRVYLSHEFVHLITFNQKDRMQEVSDDTWLNESRADYAPTIMGYDNTYGGSNLQHRVNDFLVNPSDPLTEWLETKYDYGVADVFTQYLVNHYSISTLIDSLHSKSVGIASINEALTKEGAKENFSQIFTNWTIATLVNDCHQNPLYCYNNNTLSSLRITPTINFLPVTGSSSLTVTNLTKNWEGQWQKFIGGNGGDLTVQFSSLAGLNFQVPYILFDSKGSYSVNFMQLDSNEKGQITVKNFGTDYTSLVIVPSLQSKTSGFDGLDPTYPYTFTASIKSPTTPDDPGQIQNLLAQIDALKKQIAALQAAKNGTGTGGQTSCTLATNLWFGMTNNSDVRCLQQFLAAQGSAVYPEGLVTGTFGALTRAAVVRFQTKYAISATGFVGPLTRSKINSLL